ncbi:MAG: ribosome-binding factor A [Fusobacteriia bacterium 4572_132]|nr:MAG: ribosome-binding factor A [Fusobacteriia bacterium 4572_132]
MKKYREGKIEKEMARVITRIFQEEITNPKLNCLISITKIKVTSDLKEADVYASILGIGKKEVDYEEILEGLNESRKYIRKRVGQEMKLRNTPALRMKLDDSIEYSAKINKILDELK